MCEIKLLADNVQSQVVQQYIDEQMVRIQININFLKTRRVLHHVIIVFKAILRTAIINLAITVNHIQTLVLIEILVIVHYQLRKVVLILRQVANLHVKIIHILEFKMVISVFVVMI